MPGVCMPPAQRDAGYRAFGFQWEAGKPTPIGMSLETVIVPRVGVNCALCHVGRVDLASGPWPLLGAPNTSLDLQSYLRFLFRCAASDAFTPDAILAENARLGGRLNPVEKLFYRLAIIPQVKRELAKQQRQLAFMDQQPDWGPGRAAGFQPAKVQVLGRAYDGTLDIVDIPPLWHTRLREGGGLHWDGVNTSIHEVFLNSGIGNGASAHSINRPSLARMEAWVRDLPAAPYPGPVDPALAQLAVATPFSIKTVRTATRLAAQSLARSSRSPAWGLTATVSTPSPSRPADAFLETRAYRWRYTHFRKTDGYVAGPLSGIWARAPYLHNGSVPNLQALLSPPDQRPVTFQSRRAGLRRTSAVGFVRRATGAGSTTRACPATAPPATSGARTCRRPTAAHYWNI